MVFILDGCSFHVAHVWCKQGLFPNKNRIWWLFRCNQIPSTNRFAWFTPCVRIVKWATIYYKNHGIHITHVVSLIRYNALCVSWRQCFSIQNTVTRTTLFMEAKIFVCFICSVIKPSYQFWEYSFLLDINDDYGKNGISFLYLYISFTLFLSVRVSVSITIYGLYLLAFCLQWWKKFKLCNA